MNFIDLGQVSALRISSVPPTNTKLLWYDTNITTGPKFKYWEEGSQSWQLLGDNGSVGNGAPVTFVSISLGSLDEEVVLDWSSALSSKHGTRPVYLDLYELNTDVAVQSTSRFYSEDNGLTYRWYVGIESPRTWEIRIMGYTLDPLPNLPSAPLDTIILNETDESSS